MAKEQPWRKEGGKGWKQCPTCSVYVRGGRTRICPKCHGEIPLKTKGGTTKQNKQKETTSSASSADEVRRIIKAVQKAGGVEAVRTALASYKTAERALASLGGPEGAEQALSLFEMVEAALAKR